MERLVLLVQAAAAVPPPDLYVVSRGAAAEAMALPLARSCRAAGLVVELDLSGAAFGKQFKRADRSGARWAAVIGEQEAADGSVRLKALRPPLESRGSEGPQERVVREQYAVDALLRCTKAVGVSKDAARTL
jgi:histidyl-tRNA synthetase